MTWTQERSTVNQHVQIGAESTSALGTSVSAGKLLQCFDFQFGVSADVNMYRATGRKYDSTQIENTEWVDGTMTGPLDYNGLIYPLASVMGSVAPAAYSSSATAKGWTFSPPTTGSIVPQTYTIEQGDTTTRAHKVNYGLFTDFGYKGDRKKGLDISCKILAQALQDGITMTSTPTAVALAPLAGKHVNFYLDSTYGGLGTTQLTKVLNVDFSFGGVYGPFYPFNRANIGWTAHVDMAPKTAIKLLMEADATGMTELTRLQDGATHFLRVSGQGAQIANDGGSGSDPIYNMFQHDMAVKVTKANPFSDSAGVFCVEWELDIVEDSGLGPCAAATRWSIYLQHCRNGFYASHISANSRADGQHNHTRSVARPSPSSSIPTD